MHKFIYSTLIATSLISCKDQEISATIQKEESLPKENKVEVKEVPQKTKTTFEKVTSELDHNSDFYHYSKFNFKTTVDTLGKFVLELSKLNENKAKAENNLSEDEEGQTKKTLSTQQVDQAIKTITTLLADSGAYELEAIGKSSFKKGDIYLNKSLIYAKSTEGSLFKILGSEVHDLASINFLPKDTFLATGLDFNLDALWKQILKTAQDSKSMEFQMGLSTVPGALANKDIDLNKLLASYGNHAGMFCCLSELEYKGQETPEPKFDATIFLKVKDAYIEGLIRKNLEPLQPKEETFKNYQVLELPSVLPKTAPALAISKDYILISTEKSRLKEAIQNFEDKKGFVSTPAFKKSSEGIQKKGNSYALLSPTLLDQLASFTKAVEDPEAQKMIKTWTNLLTDFIGSDFYFYNVTAIRKDGLMSMNNFNFRQDKIGGFETNAVLLGITTSLVSEHFEELMSFGEIIKANVAINK